MASASFQLSSDNGATWEAVDTPFADATALAYNAAGTYPIKARFDSTAGIDSYTWTFVGADDEALLTLPAITVDSGTKIASFSIPKTGGAWLLRATVNGGLDPLTNEASTSLVRTLAIKVKASTFGQMIAVGETTEASTVHGYIKSYNDMIRGLLSLGGGGGGTPRTLVWDTDGVADATTATTLAELKTLIEAEPTPASIYLRASGATAFEIDDSFSWQGSSIRVLNGGDRSELVLTVQAGQTIEDVPFMSGFTLDSLSTGGPAWANAAHGSTSDKNYHADNMILRQSGAGGRVIVGVRFDDLYVRCSGGVFLENNGDSAIEVGIDVTLNLYQEGGLLTIDTDAIRGDASADAFLIHEGECNFPIPAQANYLGAAIVNSPVGIAGGAGATAFVPDGSLLGIVEGCTYRNTSTGHTIRYNSTRQFWEIDDVLNCGYVRHLTAVTNAGSFTVGVRFRARQIMRLAGVRLKWLDAAAHNLKCQLWLESGPTSRKNETFAVAADATGTVLRELYFATPYDLVAGDVGVNLILSAWETGATAYSDAAAPAYVDDGNYPVGPDLFIVDADTFAAGDGCPITSAATFARLLEPIFVEAT